MAFNSADTAAFKNVWVFCEQRQGVMMPTTFELISEGRKLANELGVELCGILLGDNVDGIAAELGEYGADKVYVYNSPLLKDLTTDAYTKVIVEAVEELKPEVLLGVEGIYQDRSQEVCGADARQGELLQILQRSDVEEPPAGTRRPEATLRLWHGGSVSHAIYLLFRGGCPES